MVLETNVLPLNYVPIGAFPGFTGGEVVTAVPVAGVEPANVFLGGRCLVLLAIPAEEWRCATTDATLNVAYDVQLWGWMDVVSGLTAR